MDIQLAFCGNLKTTSTLVNTPSSLLNRGFDSPRNVFAPIFSFIIVSNNTVIPSIEGTYSTAIAHIKIPDDFKIPLAQLATSINQSPTMIWSHDREIFNDGVDQITSTITKITATIL